MGEFDEMSCELTYVLGLILGFIAGILWLVFHIQKYHGGMREWWR